MCSSFTLELRLLITRIYSKIAFSYTSAITFYLVKAFTIFATQSITTIIYKGKPPFGFLRQTSTEEFSPFASNDFS